MHKVFSQGAAFGALVFLVVAGRASATPVCGTVAAPQGCSVTIGGTTTFTFSAFAFPNAAATGNGVHYQAADVAIDVLTSGTTAILTFSKDPNGPSPGTAFTQGLGGTNGFIVSYNLAVTPALPGAVDLVGTLDSSMSETEIDNAFSHVQIVTNGGPSCVLVNSNQAGVSCAYGPNLGTSFAVGDIVSLTGGGGRIGLTSISSFSNQFTAAFTPAAAAAPEPSTFALIGLSAIGFGLWRKRK